MQLSRIPAILVHLLTASGVLCTLFAFIAIMNQNLVGAFLWLGLALIIDAIDGPLARFVDTKAHLPRFSGERLDLIIDYLNYVVLPAFLVVNVPVIEGNLGYLGAALILMTSLYHFSDLASKTEDGYFVGFPAIWNIVLFYLLAFQIVEEYASAVILVFSLMTFIPIRWLHPFRVERLRWLTVAVVLIWTYAAYVTVLSEFKIGDFEQSVLIATVIYLIAVSLARNLVSNTAH